MEQDIAQCARIVQEGDPDRFLAAMSTSGALRDGLMVLFAFNVEVSRAPWVTQEPMIAEMRLQWWLDAVEEIFEGGMVRRHEVVTPLAHLVQSAGLPRAVLEAVVTARRWDIYRDAHEDEAAFWRYLEETGGGVMELAWRAGSGDAALAAAARAYGTGVAVAALLQAIPKLEAAGRVPLMDGSAQGVRALASEGLERLGAARRALVKAPRPARAALRSGWLAQAVLQQAVRDPGLVGAGGLGLSEAGKRLRLMWVSAVGGF